ncbi:PREDICTED: uncharacterized protein LOC108563662 [Nicrophorus vespilloides]|uniref:Uncharacterized protein LOC108563662 n=1 Tax=Nicrophorus vespilloides TaxID=110193 RepID=A0ABM1MTI9_NICVS|nr:PREDICTED: uncharacterized protein LOC108563662 [Nicrophorus vespilloides]
MKYFVLVVLAIAQCGFAYEKGFQSLLEIENNEATIYAFENKINQTLECVKGILLNGDEELGFPSLDPLVVDAVEKDLTELGIPSVSGHVSLKNLRVEGIAGWKTTHLKVTVTIIPMGAKVEITLLFPKGSLVGDYDIDAHYADTNVKGVGHVEASHVDFQIAVKLQATLKKIGLKTLTIVPSLKDAKLELGELLVNGEDKSGVITDFVAKLPAVIKEKQKEIGEALSKKIMDAINNAPEGGSGAGSVILDIINKKCPF